MWIVVGLTVLAAGLRLYRLRYGYAHGVTGYDDGVYLGSALELLDGRLPYRDYVLVHPPGITVLLLPVAGLSKLIGTAQAMGLAKVLTGLAGVAAVPVAARIVWHRGVLAAVIAAGVVAVHGDVVASGSGVLLEPWLVLCCLLAVLLTFAGDGLADGRRLTWGGALFGVACAIKIWAVVPLLVAVVLCGPVRRRRYLLAAGGAFTVVAAPFAFAAPGAFMRDVFVYQLLRDDPERTSAAFRVVHLFAVGPPNGRLPEQSGLLVAAGLVIAGALALLTVRLLREHAPLARFVGAAAVLVVAMLFVPSDFYWHYAAFAAPFLGLVAAMSVPRLRAGGKAAAVACVLALALTSVHRELQGSTSNDDGARLASAVPAGACVVSEQVSSTIAADRFAATDPDCPALLDTFGTALVHGAGSTDVGVRSASLRALWLHALAACRLRVPRPPRHADRSGHRRLPVGAFPGRPR